MAQIKKKALTKSKAVATSAGKPRMQGPNPFKTVFTEARAMAGIARWPAARLLTLATAADVAKSAGAAVDQRERDPNFPSSQKVTAPPCLAMQTLAYMKLHCGLAVEFAQIDKSGRIIAMPTLEEVRGVLVDQQLIMTDEGYEAFANFFARKAKKHADWMSMLSSTLAAFWREIFGAAESNKVVTIKFSGKLTDSGKGETLKIKPTFFVVVD